MRETVLARVIQDVLSTEMAFEQLPGEMRERWGGVLPAEGTSSALCGGLSKDREAGAGDGEVGRAQNMKVSVVRSGWIWDPFGRKNQKNFLMHEWRKKCKEDHKV